MGYDLYRSLEEDQSDGFKSAESVISSEARKDYLVKKQEEINNARSVYYRGQPFVYSSVDPNKQVSKNLFSQQILASRELAEGKKYADEITNRIGAYGKYYIKHKDGMTTWYFNALLTNIFGEKVKDKLGHQSIKDTIDMAYNEKRQLTEFKQIIKDQRGNKTERIWEHATYWAKEDSRIDYRKGKNMLAGYHEIITYPTGEIIDRNVSNLTYYTLSDQKFNSLYIEKQIASYDEINRSNQSPDAPTVLVWHDSKYVKRPFSYTQTDPFDEEKYPKEEDRYDFLLTEFEEESTTLDVTTSRVWSNPVYNDNEQLTSYHESIDSLGFHTDRDFYNANYDNWGRIISYREKINTEGLVTERYWYDGKYNDIDQLMYYREDLYQNGVWVYTVWENPIYNSIGQLMSYHTITETGGVEIETIRSNISYNSFGLPEGYDEVVKSLGMVISTERRNISYEEHGWVTGWEDTIREQGRYVDEIGNVVNIDRTYIMKRYGVTYFYNGLISSYHELVRDFLDIITNTYRYGISYSRQGLLTGYIEEIIKEGNGVKIGTKTIRDSIRYNGFGQMTGFHDLVLSDESPELITEIIREGINYNSEGEIIEYTEIIHKYSKDKLLYDTETRTHRYGIIYNSIGKPTKYKEEIINELGSKVCKIWWGAEYNPVGLLTLYHEKIIYSDKELNNYQYHTIYDAFDRVVGYKRKDVDQFNVETGTIKKDMQYSGQNIMHYHEDILRLGQKWSKDWFGAVYNSKGQIVEYKEKTIDPFDVENIMRMYGMEYNLFGQLIYYQSMIERGLDFTNIKIWTGGYNKFNQLYSYNEISDITDGVIKLQKTTKRLLTQYNENGYVEEYREETIDASSPEKITERYWLGYGYGDKGLLTGYSIEETECGVTKTTERNHLSYDSFGRETGYIDTVVESNQPDKTIIIERRDMKYGDTGRINEFSEVYQEAGLNLNYSKSILRNEILYNEFGNQISYKEIINESNAIDRNVIKTWSGTYNAIGLVTRYMESTKKGVRPVVIFVRDIMYETNGFEKEYIENITDYAVSDKPSLRKWNADAYNNFGQLVGYTEIIDADMPIEKKTIKSGMQYENNMLVKYNEILIDAVMNGKVINKEWEGKYNGSGQINSYKQTAKETGDSWDKTIIENRYDMVYDSQGREYSFTEIQEDLSLPDKTMIIKRVDTKYNGFGLVSSYVESEQNSSKTGKGMDYTIITSRSGIDYNENDQIINYKEKEESSVYAGKVTDKEWTADGYNKRGYITGDSIVMTESNGNINTEIRSNIMYNDKDQISGYKKIHEASITPALVESSEWKYNYNNLGLIENYSHKDTNYDKETGGDIFKTIQEISQNINYNLFGQIYAYIEKVKEYDPASDDISKTTITDWVSSGYDALGQCVGFQKNIHEIAEGLDIQKIITRTDIEYENGLVKKYIDILRDNIALNKTITSIWEGLYNTAGELSESIQTDSETGIDSLGSSINSLTASGRTGVVYNDNGQLLGYTDTKTYPSGLNEIITRLDTQYNELGLVTSYLEHISRNDQPGVAVTRLFKDCVYDRRGRLITYLDMEIDSLGKSNVKRIYDAEYNEKGQITDYYSETSQYGVNTITHWFNGKYNADGRLIGFCEENVSGDSMVERDWKDAIYNNDGRLIYYKEIRKGNTGKIEDIEWKNAKYDTQGNLIEFTEENTSAGLISIRTRKNAKYMSNGLLLGYEETLSQKDKETYGSLLNIIAIKTWETLPEYYDRENRILRYKETVTQNGTTLETLWISGGYTEKGQISGYTEETKINGITSVTNRTSIEYNENGEIIGYEDRISNSNVPDLITNIKRLEQTYKNSKLIGYKEIIRYSGPDFDREIITNRKNISYNSNGNITGYIEETNDSASSDLFQVLFRENQAYNSLGQIMGYEDVIHNYGAGMDKVQTVKRDSILYDINGLETGYIETIKDNLAPEFTKIFMMQDKTYVNGAINSYTLIEKNIGIGLDRTKTVNRVGTTYIDGLVNGYTEIYNDTAMPGVVNEMIVSGQTYNSLGQITGYMESHKEIAGDSYLIEENIIKNNITYNTNGSETGYIETILNNAFSDITSVIEKGNEVYNSLGQLIGYNETKHIYKTTNKSKLDLSISVIRDPLATIYDSFGRLINYREITTNSATPKLEKVIDVSDSVYNLFGQIAGYKENTHYEDIYKTKNYNDYELDIERDVSGIKYNDSGLETNFLEKIKRSGNSETIYTLEVKDKMYNEFGQVDNFSRIITQFDIDNETENTEEVIQSDMEYNNKNQLIGYDQNISHSSSEYALEYALAEYNNLGQIESYSKTVSNSFGVVTKTNISEMKYNKDNQIKDYCAKSIVTAGNDGSAIARDRLNETEWSGARYNDIGQITKYKEKKIIDGETLPVSEWTGKTFEDKGQYLDFQTDNISVCGAEYLKDISKEENDIVSTAGEEEFEANKKELFLVTPLVNLIVFPVLAILNNRQKIKSADMVLKAYFDAPLKILCNTYYNNIAKPQEVIPGFLQEKTKFYLEMPESQGIQLDVKERLETQYNEIGQVVSYAEKVINVGGKWGSGGELITATKQKTIFREDISYNILGQAVSYSENEIDDYGVEKKSERTNMTYNELGLMDSYSDYRLELGIEKHEDVSNLAYNENGQLVAYYSILDEKAQGYMTDGIPVQYENTIITERLATEYGETGLLTGMTEKVWSSQAPAVVNLIEKADIIYDAYGNIFGIKEITSNQMETITSIKSNMNYTSYGNLSSFEEKVISSIAPDLVTIKNWSGAVYSTRGELNGYTEAIRREGSDLILEIRKSGISYDILGRVTGYELVAREYSPLLDISKKTIRKNITYNLFHQLMGYEETAEIGNIVENVIFGDAKYDLGGRLLQYSRKTSKTGQATVSEERLHTVYNSLGQVVEYTDKIKSSDSVDLTKLINVKNILYNTIGQTFGYEQIVCQEGGNINKKEYSSRSNSVYDSCGRIISYNAESVSLEGLKNSQNISLSYNIYDQVITYKECGIRFGEMYQYNKTDMQYDIKNRLTSYYEQEIFPFEAAGAESFGADIRSANIIVDYNNLNQIMNRYEQGKDRKGNYTMNTTYVGYNSVGQQISYKQTKSQNNESVTIVRENTLYNGCGLVTGYSETTKTSLGESNRIIENIIYDNQLRMFGFNETGRNEDGSGYVFFRANIRYDDKEKIISFTEQGYNLQSGKYYYTRDNIYYDRYNRIAGYSEQGKNNQTGMYGFTKSGIQYDNKDRITNYTESGRRQNVGAYKFDKYNMIYDALGRIVEYRENGEAEGQGVYNLHRYGINYNNAEIDSYKESGWHEGKGAYNIIRDNMKYSLGLLIGFHEASSCSDGTSIDLIRKDIIYNSSGQIEGYTESGFREGAGNYNLKKSEMQYDAIGQIISYREAGNNQNNDYSYTRYEIQYDQNGRIEGYAENGLSGGKGYFARKYDMNYYGNGLISSYKEDCSEGKRTVWNMTYNSNGALLYQNVKTDKDNFQFGGDAQCQFEYDSYGNISQTKINTPDYWVVFDKDGKQTGFRYSTEMQNYIDETNRQVAEAEQQMREAEAEMRDAERKINEIAEVERMEMEEARKEEETQRSSQQIKNIRGVALLQGAVREKAQSVKANILSLRDNISKKQEQAQKVKYTAQQSRFAIEQAQDRAQQAKLRAEESRSRAENSRGKIQQSGNKIDEASSRIDTSKSRIRQMNETLSSVIVSKKEYIKTQVVSSNKTITNGIQIIKEKLSDGNTKVQLFDTKTGNYKILEFDSFGDKIFKYCENNKTGVNYLELHNFARDGNGFIVSDSYCKETWKGNENINTNFNNICAMDDIKSEPKEKVTEYGFINYNKFGQVTSAEIIRIVEAVGAESIRFGIHSREVVVPVVYTEEINITTTEDSLGRVLTENETTKIFQDILHEEQNTTQNLPITTTRDRVYVYGENSALPTSWVDTVKRSDQDMTITTRVSDIKYNNKGQMTEYRETERRYGISTSSESGVKRQTIDITREYYRYNILYNDENRISSYKEIRHSNDKPGMLELSDMMNIAYNAEGLMSGYTEILMQYGWSTGEDADATLVMLITNDNVIAADLIGKKQSQGIIFSSVIKTERTSITYNLLGQITGYKDEIYTGPLDTFTLWGEHTGENVGKGALSNSISHETIYMSSMIYKPTGELNSYFEEKTGINSKSQITIITNIDYDSLGRLIKKSGPSYHYEVSSFDSLGRPTYFIEEYGDVSSKHYGIIYDILGRVSDETIKVKQELGGLISYGAITTITDYKYSYNQSGDRSIDYQNEIYRKISSSPLGSIVKTAVGVALTALTWGMVLPVQAAIMAFGNMVLNVLSGTDLKQALIGAGISIAATLAGAAIGGYLSGGIQGITKAFSETAAKSFFENIGTFDALFQGLSLIDQLMVDHRGKGLFEQIFGEWGPTILAGISIAGGLMAGGNGINGPPPSSYQIAGTIGRMTTLSILTALGDEIDQNLKQFLSGFFSQLLVTYANQETVQKQHNKDLKEAGLEFDLDKWGNAINIRLPEFIANYANAVATGGNSVLLDIANELTTSALQKDREGFWTKLKDGLNTTKEFSVYLAEQFGVGLYEGSELAKEFINAIAYIEVLSNRSRFDRIELSEIDRSTLTGKAIYNAIFKMKYENVPLINLLNEGFVQWIGDTGIPNYHLPGAFEINRKKFEIIFTNGIGNDEVGAQKARNDLQKELNHFFEDLILPSQAKVGYIHNKTYGLGGVLDLPQALAEYFGMTDDTSEFKAYYINERMKDDSNLIMILTDHSQGALKDDRAWDLIDNQYKDRIYVVTNGGAQMGGYPGAAAVINIIKVGDLVPLGSIVKSNFIGPRNECYVTLPTDSPYDWIPGWSLNNHLYIENYKYMNAQIITRILTHDSNEDFDSIFKGLDYGNN